MREQFRILIVEDIEINRDLLRSILEDKYVVDEARDGAEAIDMLSKVGRGYSFVLLDIIMPKLDGFAVMEFMKETELIDDVPVMVLTDKHDKETILKAYSLGASDFLEKPYVPEVIIKRMESVLQLFAKGSRDVLTGGLNRRAFIFRVENALKKAKNPADYAIYFFDIKNFKATNELFGIEVGDYILKLFYNDLLECDLKPIFTSRIEADHFACFVRRDLIDFKRASKRMEKTLTVKGKRVKFYGAFGVYYVEDATTPVSVMIDRAKIAREHILDESAKPYAVYDESMREVYVDHAEALSEFENGIENNEFQVYYQPVVDSKTEKLVSAEALVRWIHPEKGFVSPGAFIPALEKNGHISRLDRYMVDKVNKMILDRESEKRPTVPISVNLSWMDFYDDAVIGELVDLLHSRSISSNRIRLEVTETSYAALEENRSNMINNFRMFGATILLDDFGTGFASFGMLENYGFDILKIDMSFVRKIATNEKSKIIIKGIVDMCHQMGIKTVAEGAETIEQVEFLRECDCDFIQGYYYSKPLPQDEFISFINNYAKNNLIGEM